MEVSENMEDGLEIKRRSSEARMTPNWKKSRKLVPSAGDLDLHELVLHILPLNPHAKIQVCMSVCSPRRVRRTHTRRRTPTDVRYTDVKTITPDMSHTWGVKI